MTKLRDKYRFEIILIGGSAGSFPVVNRILEHIHKGYRLPVVFCLHRLKDKREGFKEALEIKSSIPVIEPNDKDFIEAGKAYIAPANYHLLIENKKQFSLSTTELVQYSRPSIDVLFESAADIFGSRMAVILLSGANRDGALGMKRIKDKGGHTIIQDLAECAMTTMPEAAKNITQIDQMLTVDEIIAFINNQH